MENVKGSAGWSIVSDKSLEFYKDPDKFISDKQKEHKSNIFLTRVLNVPTVFLCGYKEVYDLLHRKADDFDHGYKSFLFNSYGDNILFSDGKTANVLHSVLSKHFIDCDSYMIVVKDIFQSFLENLFSLDKPVDVYTEFKRVMTQLCLSIFLGYQEDDHSEMLETISTLTTQHWHGIISIPLNLNIPFAGRSGWNKALKAKEELLKIIRSTIKDNEKTMDNNNPSFVRKLMKELDYNTVEQHILLFVSALIPKAFSSIITSFIAEMAGDDKLEMRRKAVDDDACLRNILLEIQRLYPPFIGGRRLAVRNTSLGKYKIPKGYSVFYVAHQAHRDPKFFKNPDEFDPNRWDSNTNNLFCFGGGKRQCIGTHLIMKILFYVSRELLKNSSWVVDGDCSLKCKRLPVARPQETVFVTFKKIK